MNYEQAERFAALCEDPTICNANAYFVATGSDEDPHIDWMCRKDLADNGVCWCGKLQLFDDAVEAER